MKALALGTSKKEEALVVAFSGHCETSQRFVDSSTLYRDCTAAAVTRSRPRVTCHRAPDKLKYKHHSQANLTHEEAILVLDKNVLCIFKSLLKCPCTSLQLTLAALHCYPSLIYADVRFFLLDQICGRPSKGPRARARAGMRVVAQEVGRVIQTEW